MGGKRQKTKQSHRQPAAPKGPKSKHSPPGHRPARGPVDDAEYVDDLRRQHEDFTRTRVNQYFDVYRDASKKLSTPSSYGRADLTTDAWTLWGMLTRDALEGTLRSVRSVNQLAADTPVPTQPHRRAETQQTVVVRSGKRPLHLRCTELVSQHATGGGRDVISPAEVEIRPNPLRDGDDTVILAVNAAAPAGLYTGRLLVFDQHPDHPIEAIRITIDVPTLFSRA
jgi:hypothetical protein